MPLDLDPTFLDKSVTTRAGETRSLRELLKKLEARLPEDDVVEAAAALYSSPSGGTVLSTARWLDLLADLRELSVEDRLEVFAHVLASRTGARRPEAEVIAPEVEAAGAKALPWARRVLAVQLSDSPMKALDPATAAAGVALIRHAPAERTADALLKVADLSSAVRSNVALLVPASAAARNEWLRSALAVDDVAAADDEEDRSDQLGYLANRVGEVLPALHLFTDDAGQAVARAALELLEADERFGERVARVRAALGGVEQAPETDAEGVEEAVEYAKNELNLARGAARAPAEIEAAAGRGIRVDDAAELHSLEAWEKATPERRKDIATRVAAAFPGGELELHTIEGTVATLRYTPWGILFVLVIGGELSMGLSPSEEAVIRAEAEVRAGTENWEEEFGAFLQSVDDMRPVRTVTLAPFLLAREAGGAGVALGRVPDMLESAPFRLPSEAEWEWAARGGVKGELTPFGNTVPEEPSSFVNRFGLADMGLKPELCSDERAFGYQGAPVDGTPRRGPGPRVARGGAAMLWPWQACGEWQLLMNATRGSTHGWEVGLSLRPVVGISPT